MTTKFSCDLCGNDVGFEENSALVSKGEKHADLCPKCLPKVREFIESNQSEVGQETSSPANLLSNAISLVKGAGFIIYKKGGSKK